MTQSTNTMHILSDDMLRHVAGGGVAEGGSAVGLGGAIGGAAGASSATGFSIAVGAAAGAGLAAAGVAGFAVGTFIYNNMSVGVQDAIGGTIANMID